MEMDNRCGSCLNGRLVVSENGFHYICCLTQKKALNCLIGIKDSYDGYESKGVETDD